MTQTVSDRVRALAADLFALRLEDVRPESSPHTIEAWDSVQHLNLTLDLEMTFGIEFTPDELESMTSIGAVIATVEQKLGSSARPAEAE